MLDETAERMNTMPMRMALNNKAPIEIFDSEYKAMQRYKRAYEKRKLKLAEKALQELNERQNIQKTDNNGSNSENS